jgi:amidase
MADELMWKSAIEQARLVRSGEVSARELVEASLASIERLNGELNAFVTLTAEQALQAADQVRQGDERPLAGVPIAIKDLTSLTAGVRTTFSLKPLADFVPEIDTTVIRRIKDAGLIMVGKTNTPELGILPVTEPDLHGPTRNPWDTGRTPGGSSGGSGSAVASGMVAVGHGGDGGGSLRIPGSCCGLVGFKPGRGRVSPGPLQADGVLGFATEGALARTVADAALMLDILTGPELGDWVHVPAPDAPFSEAARRDPGKLRVAFTTVPGNGAEVHEDCIEATRAAAALLEELGHEVEELTPDWEDENFIRAFMVVWNSNCAAAIREIGEATGRQIGPDELEPLTRRMVETASEIKAEDFVVAYDYVRFRGRVAVASIWGQHDILLTPTLAQLPLEIGALNPAEGEDPMSMLAKAGHFTPFTPPFNVTGQPAVSLPLHQTDAGLPVGVQLVGPMGRDDLLLSLSAQLEQARPWADRRPEPAVA